MNLSHNWKASQEKVSSFQDPWQSHDHLLRYAIDQLLAGGKMSKSSKIRAASMIAAAATLVVAANTASAQLPSVLLQEPSLDVVQSISAAQMMVDFHLSEIDAKSQILRQDAQVELSEKVASELGPDQWGGSWIDHLNNGQLVVLTTNETVAARVLQSINSPEAIRSRILPVKYSLDKLDKVAIESRHRLDNAHVGVANMSLDVVKNVVDVSLLTTDVDSEAHNREVAGAILSDFPVVLTPSLPSKPVERGCSTNFEICDPSLRGGIEIQAEAPSGEATGCTVGFVVRSKSTHIAYAMTAAHCFDEPNQMATWDYSDWYSSFFSSYGHHVIGQLNSYQPEDPPTDDQSLLKINNPSGWALPIKTTILVQQSTGNGRATSLDTSYDITGVGSSANPPSDMYMCITGSTTDTHCGRLGSPVASQPGKPSNERNVSVQVCDGDSGGPVYAGHLAYGMVQSSPSNVAEVDTNMNRYLWNYGGYAACGDLIYQGMANALSKLNVELIP